MKTNKEIYWIFFLLGIFCACKFRPSSDPSSREIKTDSDLAKICMILLHLSNADGHYAASISNVKVIETTKKMDDTKSKTWRKNDFVCFVLDKRKNIIDTLLVFQPLHPRFEYPGEDNRIGSKVIEQKSTDVLLKFSYVSTMKYLRIERVGESSSLELVDVLEIPSIE